MKFEECLYIYLSLVSTSLSREEQTPLIIHRSVDTDSHQTRAVTALPSSQSSFPVVNSNSSNLTNSTMSDGRTAHVWDFKLLLLFLSLFLHVQMTSVILQEERTDP